MQLTQIFVAIVGLLATISEAKKGKEIKKKCCAVWSSFQRECVEMAKDDSRGCPVQGYMNEPKGEWAIPDDCAVWRIQYKKCLVAKEGYPGNYIDAKGALVDGGQMQ